MLIGRGFLEERSQRCEERGRDVGLRTEFTDDEGLDVGGALIGAEELDEGILGGRVGGGIEPTAGGAAEIGGEGGVLEDCQLVLQREGLGADNAAGLEGNFSGGGSGRCEQRRCDDETKRGADPCGARHPGCCRSEGSRARGRKGESHAESEVLGKPRGVYA